MVTTNRRRRSERGIALLVVVTAVAIMAIVALEFGNTSRTHLLQGVNLRDEIRAAELGDTVLKLTRACLDREMWGVAATMLNKTDLERVCTSVIQIFLDGQFVLPIGGIGIELEGIEGIGLAKGSIESLSLKGEESFIGLAGLRCDQSTMRQASKETGNYPELNCGSRKLAINVLLSLFCDPEIANAFEEEQEDGHRYTRQEVIANMIDWVDADDKRVNFDQEWRVVPDLGEGEDAYYRELEDRYRVKDAPFDSIEELRMIRGINDELFDYLRDKVSVHGMSKVNVETASADVIATLIRAHTPQFKQREQFACGEEDDTMQVLRDNFVRYAGAIVRARNMIRSQPWRMFSPAFKTTDAFIKVAQDPIGVWVESHMSNWMPGDGMGMASPQDLYQMELNRMGFVSELDYQLFRQSVNWDEMKRNIQLKSKIYRLEVATRLGNMARRIFAIIKVDGKVVRTVYYRED